MSDAAKPLSEDNNSEINDLTDFQLYQICTLYESGVGQGQQDSPGQNPCHEGSAEYRAWNMGVLHGQEMREKAEQQKAEELPADVKHVALELIRLACKLNSETTEFEALDMTVEGQRVGDWKITVERMDGERLDLPPGGRGTLFDDLPALLPAGPGHGDS